MITIQELINLVENQAKALALVSPELRVYGSALGASLNPHLNGVDLRSEYGGLSRFIETHCSSFLTHFDKKGGNDIYQYTPPFIAKNDKVASAALLDVSKFSFWSAFVTPDANAEVWIENTTGVLSLNGGLLPGSWTHLPKVTSQEHRQIARDFLQNYPPSNLPERQELANLVEQSEYWHEWSTRIKKGIEGSSYQDWARFRKYRLEILFSERLSALSFSMAAQEKAKTDILSSRRKTLRDPHPPSQKSEDLVKKSDEGEDIRIMAHRAIERMSIAELLALNLPLGSMIRGLR